MTGGVASSGSCRPSVLTRSRTSCAADSRLRSSLNVAITIEVPWPETERNSLMPSTVLITSSTCCVINDSTSSGAPPGSPTRTETVGRSTAGKRSTPSLKKPAAPTTTSDNTIIVAKTGRRIQISASFCITSYLVFGLRSLVLGLRQYKDQKPKTEVMFLLDHFDRLS